MKFYERKDCRLCKSTKLRQRSAIYVTIVMSILLFGSETWGCKEDLLDKGLNKESVKLYLELVSDIEDLY